MTDDKLAVSQEAREAAADLAEKLGDLIFLGGNDLAAIRAGIWDNDETSGDALSLFVPAFARFEAQARLAGERAGKWQDIASAPKDGTPFLGAIPCLDGSWRITRMHWIKNLTNSRGLFHEVFAELALGIAHVRKHQPTHWQPLPEPPAILKEAASITPKGDV